MPAGAAAEARKPPPPFPLTALTGFLGAGKTTLLNRLLKDPALADTAVLVNEFGEIGLDHLLVENVGDGMVMLASGCLCCTVRGDLVTALEKLLRDRDNGRVSFRRVVIETTGLADPAPVLHTIMAHPYLVLRYRLDGVVTLVDAVNGQSTFDHHPEAVKQAAVADRLVLSKTDLLDDPQAAAQKARLVERLRALNPAAPILDAAAGEALASRLLDCGLYDPSGKTADVRRWLAEEAYADAHAHGHMDTHDRNRHDDHIRAFALTTERPIPASAFDMFLDLVCSLHGPNLLRVKGIVNIADAPERPMVVMACSTCFIRRHRFPPGPATTIERGSSSSPATSRSAPSAACSRPFSTPPAPISPTAPRFSTTRWCLSAALTGSPPRFCPPFKGKGRARQAGWKASRAPWAANSNVDGEQVRFRLRLP